MYLSRTWGKSKSKGKSKLFKSATSWGSKSMQDLVNFDHDEDGNDQYVKKSALKLSDIWKSAPIKDGFENVVDGNQTPEYSHTKPKHYVTEFVREKSKYMKQKKNITKKKQNAIVSEENTLESEAEQIYQDLLEIVKTNSSTSNPVVNAGKHWCWEEPVGILREEPVGILKNKDMKNDRENSGSFKEPSKR